MSDPVEQEFREIRPVGDRILGHHAFARWERQGYAKQLDDGLWLHYTVICTLLNEALEAGRAEGRREESITFL